MKKKRYVFILVFGLILFFSLKTYNDYRVRDLEDLIPYKENDYLSISFTKDRAQTVDSLYEWWTDDQQPATELMEFLSQYRVKRISEETYNQFLLEEDSFEFVITHENSNPAIVHALEGHVHILNGKYYEVVNGPINMEWIKAFNQKYKTN